MLSCGRSVGRLTRIATRTPVQRLGHADFISIGCLRYSTKNRKNKTGTTVKVEECLPKAKLSRKVPPLPPPPPPPPPPHASGPPIEPPQARKPSERAKCEDMSYSCPPNCPAYQEDCHVPSGPDDKGPVFKYWKHIIAALLLAGVSVYAYSELLQEKKEKPKKVKDDQRRTVVVPDPSEAKDIPAKVPYLLIGGGTAAFSAFRAIKASDPVAQVLVITDEGDFPYMRPPLSKELWYNKDENLSSNLIFRQWNGTKRSLFYEPPEFYLTTASLTSSAKGGVAVAKGWKVEKIDATNKCVYLNGGRKINYDKCLIATGASPKNLSVFENAPEKIKNKVIVFRTKEDFLELLQNIRKPEVKKIVVVGGGFLGSELSTSLARNLQSDEKEVFQIYKENFIMAQVLPEYLSEWTTKHSQAEGVNCIPNVEIHDCTINKNQRLNLTLSNGKNLEADQIIVAIGVEPNAEIAKESNLEVDPELGGFLVNAELEARSNLWVAGDAACFYDVKLGRRRIEHHDHAVISGRLAGENMTGAGKPYLHQSMFWSDLGPEIGFEAIGIIDSALETVGVFAKATDKDTPLAAVSASDENIRSSSEEKSTTADITKLKPETVSETNPSEKQVDSTKTITKENSESTDADNTDNYGKGVIFYIRNNVVVGMVLWNIFNRMSIARQLLKRGTTYEEINEAAKLFTIHED